MYVKQYRFLSTLLLVMSLAGCQAATTHYLGAKADQQDVISLSAAAAQNQRWQDLYLTIDYSLERQGQRLDIAGSLAFSESPKVNYTQVVDMKLKLFLLDADMRVVDYREIARTLSTNLEDQTPFRQMFELKDNITAFSFGYEGSFRDDEFGGYKVWKLPSRDM